MMCWSWIDSSRKREALTISCPGPGIASLRLCKAGPGQKVAKTTSCKVEWTPARSTLAALLPGQKKGPNLISSRSMTGKMSAASTKHPYQRDSIIGQLPESDRFINGKLSAILTMCGTVANGSEVVQQRRSSLVDNILLAQGPDRACQRQSLPRPRN